MTILRMFAITVLAGSLLAPSSSYSAVGERPNTPHVIVSEIGVNWIQIQSVGGDFDTDLHMHEVQTLADYACGFWNREAVLLSQHRSQPDLKLMQAGITQIITFYFLVACAIP